MGNVLDNRSKKKTQRSQSTICLINHKVTVANKVTLIKSELLQKLVDFS